MENRIIVSRHPAAVEFIARELGGVVHCADGVRVVSIPNPAFHAGHDDEERIFIPVVRGDATPEDVQGKVVCGNVPLHLAALAAEVHAIEFDGPPPRGAEYTIADMVAAGAHLACYCVQSEGEMEIAGYDRRELLEFRRKWALLDAALLAAGVGRPDDLIADYEAMVARSSK